MRPLCRCRDRAEMLVPPFPWDKPQWRQRPGPPVVLLHGLWRGKHAMEPLARSLAAMGFSTLNIPYPSARLPVPALVEQVGETITRFARGRTVHFITHSLGGMLARSLMHEPAPWQTGRVVMLVPPNCGSEIVDWSRTEFPLLHRFLGPAGRALGKDGICRELPPLPETAEVAVIMGKRALIPFFRRLLESDNDGIVSASSGKLPGMLAFRVIDADHTFIPMHPDVLRLCAEFLESGHLGDPIPTPPSQNP